MCFGLMLDFGCLLILDVFWLLCFPVFGCFFDALCLCVYCVLLLLVGAFPGTVASTFFVGLV